MTKIIPKLVLAFALVGMSVGAAYADDANTLKNKIEGFAHGGTGTLFATVVGGNTVTVTGTAIGVDDDLYLDIDAGVTVLWKATYSGAVGTYMLTLFGEGTFEVAAEGTIVQTWNGGAIGVNDDPVTVKVSGGIVSATSGVALQGGNGNVTISGDAIVSSITGVAVWGGNGKITISGNAIVTSANPNTVQGTVFLGSSYEGTTVWLDVTGGTVENTTEGGNAIYNDARRATDISGGTVTSTTGKTLYNHYTGDVNISGGTLSGALHCIANLGPGMVNVSGGTISGGTAGIFNSTTGTIHISGGTISATLADAVLNAIGVVNISGGIIRAKGGYAMNNMSTGTVAVSGGIGFAWGTGIGDVVNGNINLLPGNSASLLAWNHAAGKTEYDAGTNTDLFVYPTEITVAWAKQDGVSGVTGTLGSITGFIPVEDVTVIDGTGIGDDVETWHDASVRVYPNPTSGELYVTSDALHVTSDALHVTSDELHVTSVEIFDVMGRACNESRVTRNENEMDISFLPAGVYFVRIQTETGIIVKKVIKK